MDGVVLIAIDASEQAEKAFDWYIENIHSPGNNVCILHCVDLTAISNAVDAAECEGSSEAQLTHIWHTQKKKIKELEEKYRWKMNEEGISGKIRTESGKPGSVIIKTAKQEKARLIVIGSRGLSRFKRTFQGSVSDYVLHRASCPVCICRSTYPGDSRKGSIAAMSSSRRSSMSSISSYNSHASNTYYRDEMLASASQEVDKLSSASAPGVVLAQERDRELAGDAGGISQEIEVRLERDEPQPCSSKD